MRLKTKLTILAAVQVTVVVGLASHYGRCAWELAAELDLADAALADMATAVSLRGSLYTLVDTETDRIFFETAVSGDTSELRVQIDQQLTELATHSRHRHHEGKGSDKDDSDRAKKIAENYRLADIHFQSAKSASETLEAGDFFEEDAAMDEIIDAGLLQGIDAELDEESAELELSYDELAHLTGKLPWLSAEGKDTVDQCRGLLREEFREINVFYKSINRQFRAFKSYVAIGEEQELRSFMRFQASSRASLEGLLKHLEEDDRAPVLGLQQAANWTDQYTERTIALAKGNRQAALRSVGETLIPVLGSRLYTPARQLSEERVAELREKHALIRKSIFRSMVGGLALLVALLAMMGYITYRNLRAMINSMTAIKLGADRYGSGDLTYRIELNQEDEFGELATAFNEMAMRVQNQQARLVNSSKLASLGEMSGGIAHEINNPLTVILGRSKILYDLLEKGRLEPKRGLEMLASVIATSHRIAKIVKGLKTISRDGRADPLEVKRVSEVLEETIALCGARFRDREVELIVESFDQDICVDCRPVEISQVLLNLLNNAFDATVDASEKWVRVTVVQSRDSVEISVCDSGTGIPKEIRDRIMEPFFTTKDPGKGTGMGLSISRSIVEGHGGSLSLDEDSTNTRFVMRLPRPSAAAGTKAA